MASYEYISKIDTLPFYIIIELIYINCLLFSCFIVLVIQTDHMNSCSPLEIDIGP